MSRAGREVSYACEGVAGPAIPCHSLVTSVSVVGIFFFFLSFTLIFLPSSKLERLKREREKLRTAGEEW